MNVILLKRWRYYCYVDENRQNVLRSWFSEKQVTKADRVALDGLLDLFELYGLRAVDSTTVDLGDGFYGLRSSRKGGLSLCLVFCKGPFHDDEITFLVGATWNERSKRPEPRYAKGIAEERLETLMADRERRRLERFT